MLEDEMVTSSLLHQCLTHTWPAEDHQDTILPLEGGAQELSSLVGFLKGLFGHSSS